MAARTGVCAQLGDTTYSDNDAHPLALRGEGEHLQDAVVQDLAIGGLQLHGSKVPADQGESDTLRPSHQCHLRRPECVRRNPLGKTTRWNTAPWCAESPLRHNRCRATKHANFHALPYTSGQRCNKWTWQFLFRRRPVYTTKTILQCVLTEFPKHVALDLERIPNHYPGLESHALLQLTTYGPTGC